MAAAGTRGRGAGHTWRRACAAGMLGSQAPCSQLSHRLPCWLAPVGPWSDPLPGPRARMPELGPGLAQLGLVVWLEQGPAGSPPGHTIPLPPLPHRSHLPIHHHSPLRKICFPCALVGRRPEGPGTRNLDKRGATPTPAPGSTRSGCSARQAHDRSSDNKIYRLAQKVHSPNACKICDLPRAASVTCPVVVDIRLHAAGAASNSPPPPPLPPAFPLTRRLPGSRSRS